MKYLISVFFLLGTTFCFAQSSKEEQEVMQLSKDKWQWMADKDVDKLEKLLTTKQNFFT